MSLATLSIVALCLALAAGCVVLGRVVLRQRRDLADTRHAAGTVSAALDDVAGQLRGAAETRRFETRAGDPDSPHCWEVKDCGESECPAYGSLDLRCWELAGDVCPGAQAEEGCESCSVYRGAGSDDASRLYAHFNLAMALLQREAVKLEETKRQVDRASRLATAGEFAAGVAHEINNPLDGILSCVARLERDPANLAQNMEYLSLIRDALQRISKVVQHLLTYSHTRDLQIEPQDIHPVIENVVSLIKTSAHQRSLSVGFEFGEVIPLIAGDRYQLEQAFLNLALNAIAATPEGGSITFRTQLDGATPAAGQFVEVDVIDSGSGVDPAHMDNLFDPFFTTKEPGKGTGLGLAIVKSIIEQHAGQVSIESIPGEGTTVRVLLPAAGETAAGDVDAPAEAPAP